MFPSHFAFMFPFRANSEPIQSQFGEVAPSHLSRVRILPSLRAGYACIFIHRHCSYDGLLQSVVDSDIFVAKLFTASQFFPITTLICAWFFFSFLLICLEMHLLTCVSIRFFKTNHLPKYMFLNGVSFQKIHLEKSTLSYIVFWS